MIVDSFDYWSDILIEVIEIGDKLDEAKIDESIFTSDDATIDLLLSRGRGELRRKLIHDVIYTFIELIG